jgi:hypothetical protein
LKNSVATDAQATTVETWETTFSDGHTKMRDRERNI